MFTGYGAIMRKKLNLIKNNVSIVSRFPAKNSIDRFEISGSRITKASVS